MYRMVPESTLIYTIPSSPGLSILPDGHCTHSAATPIPLQVPAYLLLLSAPNMTAWMSQIIKSWMIVACMIVKCGVNGCHTEIMDDYDPCMIVWNRNHFGLCYWICIWVRYDYFLLKDWFHPVTSSGLICISGCVSSFPRQGLLTFHYACIICLL